MWSSSGQAQVLQWITSKSIQSFWALKKSKPNRIQQAQPNTQTHLPKTKTLISGVRYSDTVEHIVVVVQQDPKKKKNLLWVQACKTQGSTVCGQPNLKRKKKKKVKVNQVSQSDAHSSKRERLTEIK